MMQQTKRIIDILMDSGFDRSDFRVRTERLHGGYGDTMITLFCDVDKSVKLTPRILKHNLKVTHFIMGGRVRHVSISQYGTLKDDERLEIINVDKSGQEIQS